MCFVNCSNHPSDKWLKDQELAALEYGDIVDVPFPNIPVDADEKILNELVEETYQKIISNKPNAVMCMGEFVACFRLVQKLKNNGIKVLASCSQRQSKTSISENGEIKKESIFVFCGFREY